MSYTYTTYVSALSTEAVIPSNDPDFISILPTIIDLSEQRIYRELDLLSTIVRDSTGVLTPNSRDFVLPTGSGRFVTTQGFNVLAPASSNPVRNQLTPTSRDYIDATWPGDTLFQNGLTAPSVPTMFAMITDQQIIVAPPPDTNYGIEVIGTIRPAPISATNPTTFLSLYLPDLFFAASMIQMSGYMRNFGSQSDDPKMAQSWQTQYDSFKASAALEELRKKWQSAAWSSQSVSPIATPPRT